MNDSLKIMLVDDQFLVRNGLSMLINSQPDFHVVAEASDGEDALSQFLQLQQENREPHIVMMDVRMPQMNGLEATAHILRSSTRARIIMLTTFDIDDYVFEAIRLGASGFLLKDAPPEELLTAIRTVHRGDGVIAPSATKRLMEKMVPLITKPSDSTTTPHLERIASLTGREHEILLLMARGMTNKELCEFLFLSEATVKTHVSHILAKLGARDRVQAVVMAYEAGLMKKLARERPSSY